MVVIRSTGYDETCVPLGLVDGEDLSFSQRQVSVQLTNYTKGKVNLLSIEEEMSFLKEVPSVVKGEWNGIISSNAGPYRNIYDLYFGYVYDFGLHSRWSLNAYSEADLLFNHSICIADGGEGQKLWAGCASRLGVQKDSSMTKVCLYNALSPSPTSTTYSSTIACERWHPSVSTRPGGNSFNATPLMS